MDFHLLDLLQSARENDTWVQYNDTPVAFSTVPANLSDVETTTAAPPAKNLAEGFIAAAVAVVFFGTNFVPVKKFETGDGLFFQWVLCGTIWLVGLVIQCVQKFPPFYPLAMLGGFLWATGNVCVVPIIKTIGLGQGILVWASFNLLSGWATGRFGLLGLKPQVPDNLVFNYVGMAMCFCSAFIYIFVKSDPGGVQPSRDHQDSIDRDPLLPQASPERLPVNSLIRRQSSPGSTVFDRMSPKAKRVIGIFLAVVSGLLYGVNFTPVIYIQNNYPGASQYGLDYVFAHFCGIYATSSLYFFLYCMVMRNNPSLYPRAILPGVGSGIMWAVADAAWFIANAELSEAVSFPIITSGPAVIGTLWGVLLFKEIRGCKNLLLLLLAFSIAITGSVLTGLSKA